MDVYKTEEEQGEALKNWLRQNGASLLTGLLLGLSVLFGIKAWNEYGARRVDQASNLYVQMAGAAAGQNADEAIKMFDMMVKDFSGSEYTVLAAFQMAKMQIEKGDLTAARAHLQWAFDHAGSEGVKHSARLRLARVLLGSGELDAADQLVAGVAAPSYTALYEELRGDIAHARGDNAAAQAAYERALAAMPETVAGRALIEAKRDDVVAVPASGSPS